MQQARTANSLGERDGCLAWVSRDLLYIFFRILAIRPGSRIESDGDYS